MAKYKMLNISRGWGQTTIPIKVYPVLLVECCFTSTEPLWGLLGTGAQDGHLDFHTALEL